MKTVRESRPCRECRDGRPARAIRVHQPPAKKPHPFSDDKGGGVLLSSYSDNRGPAIDSDLPTRVLRAVTAPRVAPWMPGRIGSFATTLMFLYRIGVM